VTAALTRRSALRGAAVVAVGAVVGFVLARRSDAADETVTASGANGYGPAPDTGEQQLAAVGDVPDGGGLVLADQHVVLTRVGGELHAFSATCTHQGCTVSGVSDGRIVCPCHGSVFDAATGDVVTGPATTPLPPVDVQVSGGEIVLAGG
jgi:Rieske Fe-S protein